MQQESKMDEVAEFEVKDLLGIGMTLVVLVIGIAYGLDITGDIRDDMGTDGCTGTNITYNTTIPGCQNMTDGTRLGESAEFNATAQGITAISAIPARLGTVVTIIIAAVIIGVLVRYLWIRYK